MPVAAAPGTSPLLPQRRDGAGEADGQRNERRGGHEGGDARGRAPRNGVVDECELRARAGGRGDREHVEHRQVGKVMGVDDGPCNVPKCEHTARADRRPAFALESMRDGTGNWGLPHPAPCEPGLLRRG